MRIKKSCLSKFLIEQKKWNLRSGYTLYVSMSHKYRLFKTDISDNGFVLKTCMKI